MRCGMLMTAFRELWKLRAHFPQLHQLLFSVPFLKIPVAYHTSFHSATLQKKCEFFSDECNAHITIAYIIFPYLFDFNNYQITLKRRQDNQEERMHDTDGAQKPPTAANIHWPAAQCWVVLLGLWKKAPSYKIIHCYSYRKISNLLAPFRLRSCQTRLPRNTTDNKIKVIWQCSKIERLPSRSLQSPTTISHQITTWRGI